MKILKTVFSPEGMLAVYFWGFIYLKPLFLIQLDRSTFILSLLAIFCLLFSICYIIFYHREILIKTFGYIFFLLSIFIIDMVLRPNSDQERLLYQVIYQGVIPVAIISGFRFPSVFLKVYCFLSVLAIPLFSWSPLLPKSLLGDYMAYGYDFAVPAVIGCYIGYRYFTKKWLLIPLIYQIACVVIFANRGALLACVVVVPLGEILFSKINKRIVFRFMLVGILLSAFLPAIFTFLANIADNLGRSSYGLRHYLAIFSSTKELTDIDNGISLSDRKEIWDKAMSGFNENPLTGKGLSWLTSQINYYAHNYFIDLLITGGALLMIVSVIWLMIAIKRVVINRNVTYDFRFLGFVFLLMAFPKLFFSQTFVSDGGYICLLSLPFLVNYYKVKRS